MNKAGEAEAHSFPPHNTAPEAGRAPRLGVCGTGGLWAPSTRSEGFWFLLKKKREVSKGIMAVGEGTAAGGQAPGWCDEVLDRRGRAPG